ncbi:MAG: prepilin peptidase [Phycisphaeraceae bacterium]
MLWLYFIFTFVYGSCIGSFLNVVVYRMPRGKSIVTPPSACPRCDHKLAWYDNVPILGWLWLQGKCRYCKNPISPQYPLVEFATGALLAGVFLMYYLVGWRPGFGPAHPFFGELNHTWIPLVAHLALVAALWASTLIDFKHFIIPLPIPYTAAIVAVIALPIAAFVSPEAIVWLGEVHGELVNIGIGPAVGRVGFCVAMGAMVGLGVSLLLWWRGILPQSFADAHEYCPGCGEHMGKGFEGDACPLCNMSLIEPDEDQPKAGAKEGGFAADSGKKKKKGGKRGEREETKGKGSAKPQAAGSGKDDVAQAHGTPADWLAYPHARREVVKECLFLLPAIIGAFIGYAVASGRGFTGSTLAGALNPYPWHPALHILGGIAMGFLVGGAIIWFTRIFGTLAFGKEAMGLGDVHLLAAVGAVLGPADVVAAFFIAPFLGLTMVVVTSLISQLRHGRVRVIPYGPYLAAAAVIMMVARLPIAEGLWKWNDQLWYWFMK